MIFAIQVVIIGSTGESWWCGNEGILDFGIRRSSLGRLYCLLKMILLRFRCQLMVVKVCARQVLLLC